MADCYNIVIISMSIRNSKSKSFSISEGKEAIHLTFLPCYLGSKWDLYSGKTVFLPGFVLHFLSAFGHHFSMIQELQCAILPFALSHGMPDVLNPFSWIFDSCGVLIGFSPTVRSILNLRLSLTGCLMFLSS